MEAFGSIAHRLLLPGSGLRHLAHALGEPAEWDAVAPAFRALNDLLGCKREAFGLLGAGADCGQVAHDLKAPARVALRALELLSIHVRRVGEGTIVGEQRLTPSLDLDSAWRATVGWRAEQVTAFFVPSVLAERESGCPAAGKLCFADDLDGR